MDTQEKLQNLINEECYYAEKTGKSVFVASYGYSNDNDVWNNRNAIISAIKNRGYNVEVISYGDMVKVYTYKHISLS